MKRVFSVVAALLMCGAVAKADGINLINRLGTISVSNAGIASKGSQLLQFNGISTGHSMGKLFFSTGALLSGNIQTGGVFSGLGSVFAVIGMGGAGQPRA